MGLADAITRKLESSLSPAHLAVINESSMHSVPKGSETHFKVVIVSDAFAGKSRVQRHQMVYAALAEEMKPGRLHALAITSRTPAEWAESPEANTSPLCAGGSKKG